LQGIKKKYDPDNIFNKWFPITPAWAWMRVYGDGAFPLAYSMVIATLKLILVNLGLDHIGNYLPKVAH
jgi:hypothetical protein